jgi:predicted CXXCH cytochrome family protein
VAAGALLAGLGIGDASRTCACEFVRQLLDPEVRAQFVLDLQRAVRSPDTDTGIPVDDPADLVPYYGPDGQRVDIDTFSFNCIACHDCNATSCYLVKLRSAGDPPVTGITSLSANHPIGMDYGSAVVQSRGSFRRAENITFVAGRVGCLSCHTPLNPEGRHLAVNLDGSGLCFSCHLK